MNVRGSCFEQLCLRMLVRINCSCCCDNARAHPSPALLLFNERRCPHRPRVPFGPVRLRCALADGALGSPIFMRRSAKREDREMACYYGCHAACIKQGRRAHPAVLAMACRTFLTAFASPATCS